MPPCQLAQTRIPGMGPLTSEERRYYATRGVLMPIQTISRAQWLLMRAVRRETLRQPTPGLALESDMLAIGQGQVVQRVNGFSETYGAATLRLRWERQQALIR
jgi:hypothetical protein